MSITTEDVRYGYLFLLGREPESEAVIEMHCRHPDISAFRDALLRSPEFRVRNGRVPPPPTPHPYKTWARDAIAFIHIPKTGGTTLHNLLAARIPRDRICPERLDRLHWYSPGELSRYDFFSGHFDFFSVRLIPRHRVRTVAIFRDPHERLISWYRFCRSHPQIAEFERDPLLRLSHTLTAEEYFEHPIIISSLLNNSYLFYFGTCLSAGHTMGAMKDGEIAATIRERAINNILALDGLGITERMEESIRTIFSAFQLALPGPIVAAKVTDELPGQDSRFSPVPPVTITPRLLSALDRLTEYDRELYSIAEQEFRRRLLLL